MACFQAAAEATGCILSTTLYTPKFKDVLSNHHLANSYADNLRHLGKSYEMVGDFPISTDFGNVSHIVPALHPIFTISGGGEVNHTLEFTAAANTPRAHADALIAAKAMSHTGIDVLTMEGLLEKIKLSGLKVVEM
jgi:metal-dependent amidase/aminoacylase/carboxypeptidase family protein